MPTATDAQPIINADNPPYARLRTLLRAAFEEAPDLRRIVEEPDFAALRYRFASGDGLDALIDKLFSFCRTRLLWEELLAYVARRRPNVYNRYAAQWGWPPVEALPPVHPLSPGPHPAPPAYDDVEVRVAPGPGGRPYVTLQTEQAGDATAPLRRTWSAEELTQWLLRLETGLVDGDLLTDVGRKLFRALFHDNLRDLYAQARGATRTGLRLRLWFETPDLQALPWELLYDDGQEEFPALTGQALITRYLAVPQGKPPLVVEPPLRLLIVTARPTDQPDLNAQAEEAAIRQALDAPVRAGRVRIESLPHARPQSLRQALRDTRPHILHFIGHGMVRDRGGALILENERGRSHLLDASTLRVLLRRSDSVRLAVLNACLTARDADPGRTPDRQEAFLGVGPALVRAGLGAVVAMQFTASERAAHLFARDFYQTLARPEPVDLAVSRAREALMLEFGWERREWATPVLFLRAPDGVIFAPQGAL